VRIREVIRMARHRERTIKVNPPLPHPPVREPPHRGLADLPGGPPQTGAMVKDP
jgi:hypothetical protein